MIHTFPPNTPFYRVTTVGRTWRDVLSGRGALYLSPAGNRYNVVLQQAAYVCDDLDVAVSEFAYYAARDWQDRLGVRVLCRTGLAGPPRESAHPSGAQPSSGRL